jgi:hypothetical protein
MLVAEISDTYDSLVRTLHERADHRVGLVAFGAGTAFGASVLSVSRLDVTVTNVTYVGDLDEPGLRIPANAAALAIREGLPPIRPATGLYTALLVRARTGPAQQSLTVTDAADLAAWLNPVHHGAVTRFLMDGVRAAQEAVGRDLYRFRTRRRSCDLRFGRTSWCSGMRSRCSGDRSPGPSRTGPTGRSWRRWPGCCQQCCAPTGWSRRAHCWPGTAA